MNPLIKLSFLIITLDFCQGTEPCSSIYSKYCCDPKGNDYKYPQGSKYVEGCTEYTCQKKYRKKTWVETKNLCPPALICPSYNTSCTSNPANIIETINFLPSYSSCGERCKENKECMFWTYFLSEALEHDEPIPICSLLNSCSEQADDRSISGNNLCPLEIPFPCPNNFFTCVAQDDTNVIASVSAENYEYCGELCQANTQCLFWTFISKTSTVSATCHLLDSCAPRPVFFLPGLTSISQSGDFNCPPSRPIKISTENCYCEGYCAVCAPIIGCIVCLKEVAPIIPPCYCPQGYCAECTPWGLCLKCVPWDDSTSSLALTAQNNAVSGYPGGDYNCIHGCRPCFACVLGVCQYVCQHGPHEELTSAEPRSLPEVCTYLALKLETGNCSSDCKDISSGDNCNTCLQSTLPEKCGLVPEISCFKCAKNVWDAIETCSKESISSSGVINCAKAILAGTPDCLECLCHLICFFWPQGSLCKFCGEDSSAAQLWISDEQCPLGSVKSADGACFKAYKDLKTFAEAEASCGQFSKVNSTNRILTVNQAMLISQLTECWIGGKIEEGQTQFEWLVDNSEVTTPNFARGYPTGMRPSCLTQSTRDGKWRNRDCNHQYCYVCLE